MDDKKFKEVIERLAKSSEHWLEVRKVLMDDIKSNEELIRLIDMKVKENEEKISNMN